MPYWAPVAFPAPLGRSRILPSLLYFRASWPLSLAHSFRKQSDVCVPFPGSPLEPAGIPALLSTHSTVVTSFRKKPGQHPTMTATRCPSLNLLLLPPYQTYGPHCAFAYWALLAFYHSYFLQTDTHAPPLCYLFRIHGRYFGEKDWLLILLQRICKLDFNDVKGALQTHHRLRLPQARGLTGNTNEGPSGLR
jgi:hypothetical protein